MLELQIPLLAAKALLLLLLFAFIYAVMSRGIGDLRKIPDDEAYVPGRGTNRGRDGRGVYTPRGLAPSSAPARPELDVEDLGSTNGTFVNGRKTVGATPMRDGDTVRIGATTFRYEG